MKNTKVKLFFKGTVSALLLIYLFNIVNWQRISELNFTAVITLIMSVLITLFLLVFMALRWSLLIRMQDKYKISLITTYQGYLIGSFFNIFMPGAIGGDLIRIKYCTNHCGIELKKSGLIIVTERLFGLTALSIIFTIGLFYNQSLLPGLELDLNTIVLTLAFVVGIFLTAKYWISKKITITKSYFMVLVFFSIMGQLADIVTVGLLTWNFGYDIYTTQLFFIMPLVYIATVIPLSLGGLGVREGVLSGLLMLFGLTISDAILIAFMLYLVKVCIGIIGVPFFLRERYESGQG